EREFSWMDRSYVDAISNDGRAVVFEEFGEGGGDNGAIYLRATDGSAAVRLGEGAGIDLSPDGRWVLSRPRVRGNVPPPSRLAPETLVLLPTGPGQPRSLDCRDVTVLARGRFFPDGKRVLFLGRTGAGSLRLYILDGGEPRAISPEGVANGPAAISPNGRF